MEPVMPSREEAYRLIDGERDYQDKIWGNTASGDREGDGSRSEDEFALYIHGYSLKLVDQAATFGDAEAKMDIIRKIAGLCVAAMEQHETPERKSTAPTYRWHPNK
jgi:hypothetical protein